MRKLYTVLYSFMSSELGLKGLTKEVFAIIFGFWLAAERTAIWITISNMEAITGGSRPAIIAAIKALERKGYIAVSRSPGQYSLYTVTVDASIIQDFDATLPKEVVNKPNWWEVKPHNRQKFSLLTGGSKVSKHINTYKNGTKSIIVGGKDEFNIPDQI